MPHFEVKVNPSVINLVQFKADNGMTRDFTLESFEMFMEQLPERVTEDYKLHIGQSYPMLNPKQYEGFRLNCRNLLVILKQDPHDISLRHYHR